MAKLVLVSDNWTYIQKVQEFAQKEGFEFSYYAEKDWDSFDITENRAVVVDKDVLPVGWKPVLSMGEMEYHTIKKILFKCDGNIQKTAKILRISRSTLYRKLGTLNISLKDIASMQSKALKEREGNVIDLKSNVKSTKSTIKKVA